MNVRNQLRIIAALSFAVYLILGFLLWQSYQALDRLARSQAFFQELIDDAFALRTLSFESLLFLENQTLRQGAGKAEALASAFETVRPDEAEARMAIEALRQDLQALRTLFRELETVQKPKPDAGYEETEKGRLIATQILVKSQAIEEGLITLLKQSTARMIEERKTILQKAFISLAILALLTVGTLFLVGVSLLRPLSNLGECINAIQRGDLTVRAHIRRQDEIGLLAGAFDGMVEEIDRLFIAQKRIEADLSKKSEELEKFFTSTLDLLCIADTNGYFRRLNAEWEKTLGYGLNELEGKRFLDFVHPEDVADTLAVVSKLEEGKEVLNFTNRYRCRDGSYRWIEWRSFPAGHLIYAAARDITVRKETEASLRESEERFRLLVENAPEAIFVQTAGCFAYLNPAALKLFGALLPEQLLGRPVWERFHPDFHELVKKRIQLLNEARQEVPLVEEKCIRLDDTPFDAEISAVPIPYQGCQGALVFCHDITERKQAEEERAKLEEQLRQAVKMEAIGGLAGGVAHDFNNMLGVILGYAELIKSELPEGDPLLASIEQIEKAAARSRDITGQLLAFSRKQIVSPKTVDLNDLLVGLQASIARLIGEDIETRFHLARDLWKIRIDPSQVDQIFVNLVVNARDAMPGGGKMTIETANVRLDAAYAEEQYNLAPGEYVMLAISDNGAGMDRETQSRIFEPFFTTKAVGRGTGLGLSTVYGIVTQNKGFIHVYSEPGKGTTFKIYIPRIMDGVAAVTEEQKFPPLAAGGTVLLVEDEDMLRRMTKMVLEKIGYTVLSAAHPQDALLICRDMNNKIDLILTDVVMPGMSGKELVNHITGVRSGIKVLFMSGYTSNVIAHHGVLDEGVSFIQKPFRKADLARKISEIMGGTPI